MNPLPFCMTTFLLLALSSTVTGQEAPIWEQYNPPSELVLQFDGETNFNFFFQDSRGFLWGSDKNFKLVRFDSKEVVRIPGEPGDSTAHSGCDYWHNSAKFLEDVEGQIWMLSYQACVHRYDPVTGRFERIHERMKQMAQDSLGFSSFNTFYLYEDAQHNIWIAAGGGIFKYTLATKTLNFFHIWADVRQVFQDASHNIWIQAEQNPSNRWLTMLDERTGQFVDRIELNSPIQVPGNANRMDGHSLLHGSDSILMLSNFNMYLFDASNKTVAPLENAPFDQENYVRCMYAGEELILLGTQQGELYQYSPQTGSLFNHPTLATITENKRFSDIFRCDGGTIWLTKEGTPILLFPKQATFQKVDFPSFVPGYQRFGNYADALLAFNGTVYFHTPEGLIPVRDSLVPVPNQDFILDGVRNPLNKVYNFDLDKEGNLWLAASSYSQGKRKIHLRNYEKNGVLSYRFDGPYIIEDCMWPAGSVRQLVADGKGGLWIGANGQLSYFDTNSSSFTHHFCASQEGMYKEVFFRCLYVDRDNDLWIGSNNSGLLHFEVGSEEWNHVPLNGGEEKEAMLIYSIFQDSKGTFWAGTPTGLVKFDKESGVIRKYDHKDMLQALVVEKIFEDHHQNLWVTTGNWLARYDPQRDQFIPFTREDGVVMIDYWNSDVLKDGSDFVFLPAYLRTGYFHPDSMRIDSLVPEVYFTDLQLFQEMVKPGGPSGILQQTLDYTERIVLKYAQNDFTIHYSAPEYIHPYKTVYATQLEGFQSDWQAVGTRQEAQFTNLNPGTYTFKVKVRNHHGFWSKTPRTLIIRVLPPWYRTWWAYITWGALALGLFYWGYRYQLKRQLAIAEAQRLKALDLTKSRLYTNVTHEFRTPLTIILGMADQMDKDPGNWFREGLRLIRRNGRQLLNLVNQLLDLSKLESGYLSLELVNGEVVSFLHYLTESFHSYADSKDIRLHFISEVRQAQMDYDPDKLQNVMSNLLSNAVKFTPAGGDVYLMVKVEETEAERLLKIQVKDNGLGVAPEHLSYIFDRFYQADTTATRHGEGTGIGLALTKELVKLMDGSIEVESEVDQGTLFTILLPMRQTAPEQSAAHPETPVAATIAETIRLESGIKAETLPVSAGSKSLVLLIEDNTDVITYLSSFLSTDYELETAANGQEGIDKAIERIPDLIVSDVMMPEKDGLEVCTTLKTDERTSHIPIVLLTAKSDTPARLEGLSHGADAYLAKPFNKEELLIRMEKLIELRQRLQARYQHVGDWMNILQKPDPTPEDRFLQRLVRIVEENLSDEHFGLPELCRKVSLSRSQVYRKLKALTGKSSTHFIRSIRMEKGKSLLETTDLTVAEVAFQVGFGSAAYFSRIFKEEYGMAPSEVGKG